MSADDTILRTAIRARRQVKIEYGPAWKFILEPYVLFHDSKNQRILYGYTWASDPVAYLKGSREFLVEQITSIELLDGTYERPQQDYFVRNWTHVRIDCDVYCPTATALLA